MTISYRYLTNLETTDTATPDRTDVQIGVEIPVSIAGSLNQNIATPAAFTVSNTTPTKWNAANAGTISAGHKRGTTLNATTGEITVDEPGFYDISFSGSLDTTNPSIQLCAQVFINETGIDNICDFPTSRSDGKWMTFGADDITTTSLAAGDKISVRFLSLEATDEDTKIKNFSLRTFKIGQ